MSEPEQHPDHELLVTVQNAISEEVAAGRSVDELIDSLSIEGDEVREFLYEMGGDVADAFSDREHPAGLAATAALAGFLLGSRIGQHALVSSLEGTVTELTKSLDDEEGDSDDVREWARGLIDEIRQAEPPRSTTTTHIQ